MKVVKRKISELIPAEYNPRYISDEAFAQLSASLERFGAVDPAIINIHDDRKNIIVGGHQRIKVAQKLGWDEFPCVEVELDRDKERELNIRLNKNTGAWDWDGLANYFDSDELLEWGFNDEELFGNIDVEEPEAEEDDYEIPDEIETDFVLGDLIEIGGHRLLCGDSTDSDQVAKLMDGEKADMVLTDPPYGISYEESKNWAKPDYNKRPIIGDNKPFDFNDYAFPKSKIYCIWRGNYFSNTIPFYDDSNYVVWAKAHSDDENKVFGSAFELCLMYPKHKQEVWFVRRVNMGKDENGLHPTQKPIEVITRCIKYHDKEKPYTIVDLFLGSGSTMVACHQLNRKCYGLELDPKYCQVIVDRMLKLDSSLEIKVNGEDYEL